MKKTNFWNSLPFKLLLFVTLDGWLKISQGLLLSYQ
mgnify:CR=1 FL=1